MPPTPLPSRLTPNPHLSLAATLLTAATLTTLAHLTLTHPTLQLPLCPIHHYTSLLCPGCGATHALAALAQGHLVEAFHQNPLFITLLPLLALYALAVYVRALRHHPYPFPPIPKPALITLYALTLTFTIARNLT